MKIVRLTYGVHIGKRVKKEYAYLANDNVKVGDIVQPNVNHAKSGKLFATTGVIQGTNKTTSVGGQQEIARLSQVQITHDVAPEMQAIVKDVDGKKMLVGLKKLETGVASMAIDARTQAGATFTYASTRERTEQGTFKRDDYVGRAKKLSDGTYGLTRRTKYNVNNAYVQKQREYNVQQAQQGTGTETFNQIGD